MAEPVGAGRNKKKRKGERKIPGCNGLNWAVDRDTERDSHEEVCSNNAAVLLLMKALECFLSNRPLCTAGTLSLHTASTEIPSTPTYLSAPRGGKINLGIHSILTAESIFPSPWSSTSPN